MGAVADEERREQAKKMRYKKPALERLNLYDITTELEEIGDACYEYQYFFEQGDDELIKALDYDTEAASEFKMMFTDVAANCEQLRELIGDINSYKSLSYLVNVHFDDVMVGLAMKGNLGGYKLLGFDVYETDYYHLTDFDSGLAGTEAGKRLKKLTKDELVAVCGQCLGICISFLDITHKYEKLKAAFEILKNENKDFLRLIKDIEEAYDKAAGDGFLGKNGEDFDRLLQSFDPYSQIWAEM